MATWFIDSVEYKDSHQFVTIWDLRSEPGFGEFQFLFYNIPQFMHTKSLTLGGDGNTTIKWSNVDPIGAYPIGEPVIINSNYSVPDTMTRYVFYQCTNNIFTIVQCNNDGTSSVIATMDNPGTDGMYFTNQYNQTPAIGHQKIRTSNMDCSYTETCPGASSLSSSSSSHSGSSSSSSSVPEKKKSWILVTVIVCIIVVMLAAAGAVGTYLYLRKRKRTAIAK